MPHVQVYIEVLGFHRLCDESASKHTHHLQAAHSGHTRLTQVRLYIYPKCLKANFNMHIFLVWFKITKWKNEADSLGQENEQLKGRTEEAERKLLEAEELHASKVCGPKSVVPATHTDCYMKQRLDVGVTVFWEK